MSCRACGGPLAPWISVPAGEPADRRRFTLLRCRACESAVTAGEPPGSAAYESGIYAPRPPRAAALVDALQRLTVGQPARALAAAGLAPESRVLDAGAGTGRLVADLLRRGFDARGIEPSIRSAELARAAGRPVAHETIEEHTEAGLDAVTLWHVLEHLDDPRASLERVASWLRPGGLMLVGVPNAASLQARLAGPRWLHWDAPRHRVHLTPEGLDTLLRSARLEPVRVQHMVWEHNPASMWMALLSRAGMAPGLPFHLLKRNARARPLDLALLAAGVPLAPVAVALEALAAAARRGGTVAVVARNPASGG